MSDEQVIRIGCQSWNYEDWVTKPDGETVFYPRGTKSAAMLELYSKLLDTIEVDSTAYGVPQISTVEGWYERTPPGFVFSLKVPRAVTHEFSLRPGCFPIVESFAAAAQSLREKLGVILIQLPASFEATKENAQSLRELLAVLPRDVRFAVEFRNPGWFVDWTYEELNAAGVALALVEGKWVPHELMFAASRKMESGFAYVRFMGLRDLERFDRIYRDRDENLDLWMPEITGLKTQEIFIYVDNYYEGHAPATVNKIRQRFGLAPIRPEVLEEQPSLF